MKNYFSAVFAIGMLIPVVAQEMPTISNVMVSPIEPGRVFEISYDVGGMIDDAYDFKTVIDVIDKDSNITNRLTKVLRQGTLSVGVNTEIWNCKDETYQVDSSNVIFVVSCFASPKPYCVIDLSAGESAVSYPVSYLSDVPSGGWTDEYKTTKLVLRRIESGSFIMGDNQSDESHRVTLTKPFFMGVFEVTQKQYEQVTGSNPSEFSGDTCPVEKVSYSDIRGSSDGAKWPLSSAVDSASFLGKLRARTGLDVDLPTEVQWEYACRAGTATTYYWGNSMNENYAWYGSNSVRRTHVVGSRLPNAFGLYDMSGNVWEWCLDWKGSLTYDIDPKGASSGSQRVGRGGSWFNYANYCTSSRQYCYEPSYEGADYGFRLCRVLAPNEAIVYSKAVSEACAISTSGIIFSIQDNSVIADSSKMILSFPADETATIYYTTDGTTPSTESSVFAKPFKVSPYVKIQAFAVSEIYGASAVSKCELFVGTVESPVIEPADGEVYYSSDRLVTISVPTEGTEIYYTLDGSEPTLASALYTGPFVVNGNVIVKARAVKDGYLDSEVASASLIRGWYVVGAPVISADATFAAATTMIELSCATNGATLYYTLDGSIPTVESPIYTKPIKVSETTTVKAFAVKDDYLDSDVAAFTVTKVWTMGDSLNAPNLGFTSASAQPWIVVTDVTKDGVEALKSGAVGDNGESVVSTVVTNGGTVAFWWKTSCEDDEDPDAADWDHLEFRVDGAVMAFLDGEMDWTLVTVEVTGDGEHMLEWTYVKDDSWSDGKDCGWLDLVAWSPTDGSGATQTTEAPVPYSWLDEKGFGELVGVDYEVAAKAATGKRDGAGRALTVMDDFVAGTDPAKADDVLRAEIAMEGDTPIITWEPDLNEGGTKTVRKYTVWGAKTLDGGWTDTEKATDADKREFRFFRVTVEMP